MCQDWTQECTRCGHLSVRLINCPTYHKQQNEVKGLFGRLFRHGIKKRSDCGRVFLHYAEKPFCSRCTIKNGGLRTKYVGDGAMRVHRPHVDPDLHSFHEHVERRKTMAANRHNRTEGTGPGHSVWIPELYHDPYMLSQSTPSPAVRPQVPLHQVHATPRSSRSPKKTERHQGRSERLPKQNSTHTRRNPTINHPKRSRNPTESERSYNYRHREGYRGSDSPGAPPVPPKKSPPILSQKMRHGTGSRSQQLSPKPRELPPHPIEAKKYPPLRRKQAQVFRVHPVKHPTIRPHMQSPVHPPVRPPNRVPTPKYQAYLNAQRRASEDFVPDIAAKVTAPKPRPSPRSPHNIEMPAEKGSYIYGERKSSFLQSISKAIGLQQSRPGSGNSDMSFICLESSLLSRARSSRGR